MEVLWIGGNRSIRQIHSALRSTNGNAYSTVHAVVSRLARLRAVRDVSRTSRGRIVEAALSRVEAQQLAIDQAVKTLGGDARTLLFVLVKVGELRASDLQRVRKKTSRLCER
jgi:predicted transcriptional regulator